MRLINRKVSMAKDNKNGIQNRKAQIWYADLVLALALFSVVLVAFFESDINSKQEDDKELYDMVMESKIVTNDLMTSGVPSGWSVGNVEKIGIIDNNRINMTKLIAFSTMDYNITKTLLRVKYDYYIYFRRNGDIIPINGMLGIGKPGVNATNIEEAENPERVMKITRVLILQNNPTRMEYILWK